jgi:hypothetical protein
LRVVVDQHVGGRGRRGTATELLWAVEKAAPKSHRRAGDWPKGLAQFSGLLRRLAPSLRSIGVLVEFSRRAGDGLRMIEVQFDKNVAVRGARSEQAEQRGGR